jgi:hypothetical protein
MMENWSQEERMVHVRRAASRSPQREDTDFDVPAYNEPARGECSAQVMIGFKLPKSETTNARPPGELPPGYAPRAGIEESYRLYSCVSTGDVNFFSR